MSVLQMWEIEPHTPLPLKKEIRLRNFKTVNNSSKGIEVNTMLRNVWNPDDSEEKE